MSAEDLYQFTVEWPSASPQTVIVTGDFDKWSRSLHLSRTPTGNFSAVVKVPYGCPTRYKFIVDGEWKVLEGEPTEQTPEGYTNNVHYVPLEKPSPDPPKAPNGNGTTAPLPAVRLDKTETASNGEPCEQDARSTQNSAVPQFLSDLAKTIAARDGTSSALGYVASGIGATIHSVVGVDPINSNQIPIPTPTALEPSTGLPSPMDSQTVPDVRTPQSPIAPIVPITIVPVYAKENCTIDPAQTAPEDGRPDFVGVGSLRAREDREEQGVDETERTGLVQGEMGISTHAPVVPPIVVTSAPSPTLSVTPAAEEERAPASSDAAPTAAVEKHQVEKREEEAVMNIAEGESKAAADTATVSPGASGAKPEEKVPAQERKEEKEESATVAAAVAPAPEPSQIPLPQTPAKPPTGDSSHGANEHHKSPSSASATTTTTHVASTSTSRPSTPTPAAAPSSTASTPNSTTRKRKLFPHLGNGSPSKNKEEEKGSMGSGRKKRTSSIFGKLNLKNLFHHHDKKDGQEENVDSQ